MEWQGQPKIDWVCWRKWNFVWCTWQSIQFNERKPHIFGRTIGEDTWTMKSVSSTASTVFHFQKFSTCADYTHAISKSFFAAASHRLACGHATLEKLPMTTDHPRYLILETERDGQLNHGLVVRIGWDIQQGLQIGTTGQQGLESVGMWCRHWCIVGCSCRLFARLLCTNMTDACHYSMHNYEYEEDSEY